VGWLCFPVGEKWSASVPVFLTNHPSVFATCYAWNSGSVFIEIQLIDNMFLWKLSEKKYILIQRNNFVHLGNKTEAIEKGHSLSDL
jgi:hypothetical protein